MKHYDVIIIGAGPGGIFSAYELTRLCPDLKVAIGHFGMVTTKGWEKQIALAKNKNGHKNTGLHLQSRF